MDIGFCEFVREKFKTDDFIPLHVPTFLGNERESVNAAIDSTFVSTVGPMVTQFENSLATLVGVKHAVAMNSGTAALHVALLTVGVDEECEVITQPLSFVATANAIAYIGAKPVFVDVDPLTLGLSPSSLEQWLEDNVSLVSGVAVNKITGRRVAACVPMHTFGFVGNLPKIISLCEHYGIAVVEDAAESLGSTLNGKHAGSFGDVSAVSFNGNKIVTTGGGGILLTNRDDIAVLARHLSTTAKVPHKWEYVHDRVGYNYRMPNINAALGIGQLDNLNRFIQAKRVLAEDYANFFEGSDIEFVSEPKGCLSNYWLCTIKLQNKEARDLFLEQTNNAGIMTRPAWQLLSSLTPFEDCIQADLSVSEDLSQRLVNIPSSVLKDLCPESSVC